MEILSSVLSIVGTALACIGLNWRIMVNIKNDIKKDLERQLERIEGDFDKEKEVMWRRIDERKAYIDDNFLRKEIYEVNHVHIQETMRAQYQSIERLMEEKFKQQSEKIDQLFNKYDK